MESQSFATSEGRLRRGPSTVFGEPGRGHHQWYVDKRTGIDLEILRSLRARVKHLESARSMTFVGPHDPSAKAYRAGSVVQRSGST